MVAETPRRSMSSILRPRFSEVKENPTTSLLLAFSDKRTAGDRRSLEDRRTHCHECGRLAGFSAATKTQRPAAREEPFFGRGLVGIFLASEPGRGGAIARAATLGRAGQQTIRAALAERRAGCRGTNFCGGGCEGSPASAAPTPTKNSWGGRNKPPPKWKLQEQAQD